MWWRLIGGDRRIDETSFPRKLDKGESFEGIHLYLDKNVAI
jgi:hypothetical protein